MTPAENWKQIVGAKPGYVVSDTGRVRSPRKELRTTSRGEYYASVAIPFVDGKLRTCRVHRLVLETFVGPPPSDSMQARHKNDDHTNNNLSNLLWGLPHENTADGMRAVELELSLRARRQLDALAKSMGCSRGKVVEHLLLREAPPIS